MICGFEIVHPASAILARGIDNMLMRVGRFAPPGGRPRRFMLTMVWKANV